MKIKPVFLAFCYWLRHLCAWRPSSDCSGVSHVQALLVFAHVVSEVTKMLVFLTTSAELKSSLALLFCLTASLARLCSCCFWRRRWHLQSWDSGVFSFVQFKLEESSKVFWHRKSMLLSQISPRTCVMVVSSRVHGLPEKLRWRPTTRRSTPRHSINHNSRISASLSKASWTPELQIRTLFSLVSHLHLSKSANFSGSKFPIQHGYPCVIQIWNFILIGYSSHWTEEINSSLGEIPVNANMATEHSWIISAHVSEVQIFN